MPRLYGYQGHGTVHFSSARDRCAETSSAYGAQPATIPPGCFRQFYPGAPSVRAFTYFRCTDLLLVYWVILLGPANTFVFAPEMAVEKEAICAPDVANERCG
jgi:hypothetical protein